MKTYISNMDVNRKVNLLEDIAFHLIALHFLQLI